MKYPMIFLILLFFLTWSSLLISCSQKTDIEKELHNYLFSLQTITGLAMLPLYSEATKLIPYPKGSDVKLNVKDVNIGLLNFFSLKQCDLQVLVAQRNSALGRVMPVTQQLIYEHQFLLKAKACLKTLSCDGSEDQKLLKQIDTFVAIKSENLPKIFWNATFGSPEFQKMMSLAVSPLSMDTSDNHDDQVIHALVYLLNLTTILSDEENGINSKELEQHYYRLQQRKLGGQLLNTLDLLSFYLENAVTVIQKWMKKGQICSDEKTDAEALELVAIHRIYETKIQSYVADVHQRTRKWLYLTNQLAEFQKLHMPERFQSYYDSQLNMTSPQGNWLRFEKAIKIHSQTWKRLKEQCCLK